MYKLDDEQEYVEVDAYQKGYHAGRKDQRAEMSKLIADLYENVSRLENLNKAQTE